MKRKLDNNMFTFDQDNEFPPAFPKKSLILLLKNRYGILTVIFSFLGS